MSLAMNAAPFDNIDHELIPTFQQQGQRKRNNKTVKLRSGANKISSENVNSVIANIHDGENYGSGDGEMGDFVPISPPVSVGVEQTKLRHNVEESSADNSYAEYDPTNIPSKNIPINPLSSNSVNYDKYRQYMPDYKKMYGDGVEVDELAGGDGMPKGIYAGIPMGQMKQSRDYKTGMSDPLIEKLNHVIHLLEEQHDDKTSHVTEEIVLYFFLGIFMIFIIDSFTRLGKYTR